MTLLDELVAKLESMPEGARAQLATVALKATKDMAWIPNPGPQMRAYFCKADILLYGGQAGGGKSSLLIGTAMTAHKRSLIMRRKYNDLGALTEEAIRFNGSRDGFNGSNPPKLRTKDGRLIEFGAALNAGDEETWQGQPHDFLGIDEAVQFQESQIRFLMGWVRSTEEGQRTRVVLATNPPVTASGMWIIPMFAPWLDVTHPKPAKPGELRWFVTDPDGKDLEVPGPRRVIFGDKKLIPLSRTFIPAALPDNPFLAETGYQAQLDALPEPLRTAVRDGNFMAARKDDDWQLIPTAWVLEAQARWSPLQPERAPMCAMGVDPAMGGDDEMVIAPRYDGWFAPLVVVPGSEVPLGSDIAGRVIANRRNGAVVVIDMGGGYGGGAYEHLKGQGLIPGGQLFGHNGAEASPKRTADQQHRFYNARAELYWRFREALDPDQQGGSPIALPNDPALLADLTAPRFEITTRGIKVESKADIVKRLGRSPDRGDAVVMSWSAGEKQLTHGSIWREHTRNKLRGGMPKVIPSRVGRRRQ